MSNKIALATIQFRADAKGANVALESLQVSADRARRTMKEMQDALDRGIKTMKDSNGVEFDVATKLKNATTEARSFEKAIRELAKGATALEEVVKNIRMGEIEKSSRAELKGAINGANARLRSIREKEESGKLNKEDLERQRDLKTVINESNKQLNRLDRDTAKVIETLQQGGTVAESVFVKEIKGLQEILALIPKGTKEWQDYYAQLKQIEGFRASAQTRELEQSSKLLGEKNLGKYSEEDIRKAISAGKELLATYKTASPEAQKLSQNIVAAEQHLKNYGVEAARAAAKEVQQIKTQEEAEKQLQITMNKRLRSLSTLSTEALAESKKYWQAQMDGAEKGTAAFNKAADALKKIEGQERTRKFNGLNTILGDPSKFGISEVRQAVQEMERLRDSVAQGTPLWNKYNTALKQGKDYLEQLARTEAADKVAKQMNSLKTLSASGLQEVKKYWETMVAGAKLGSTELNNYKAKLEQVTAEEQRRTKLQAKQSVNILGSNLNNYSEAQIRQAIEAGNQLIKTYKTGSTQAIKLGRDIVAAEQHLKQYGVEAARTAQREKDLIKKANDERAKANQEMIYQLSRTKNLTPEILKQQEQYWQRLINDPKTATTSLATYKNMLDQVHRLQQAMVESKGQAALNFFRGDTSNASANQLKEQAEALKKYRDSLPRQANAAVIQEIDGYLAKVGVTAQKTAEQTMKLADAEALAAQIGTKGFAATTTQLQQAKKALVEEQQTVQRGTQRFTELQAAINKVDLELAKMGELSAEVKATLDSPKGKSFNELKQAVEQGRKALAGMRTETEKDKKEFDDLAKKVKEADFQMKQLGNSSKGTATAFEKAWSRLKTYITLYVGAAMAMQKIASTIGDVLELSDKLGEVRKTTGFTADEVGRLSDSLKKIDTRTTITGLLDLSVAAGQLGLKTQEDVEGFTIAANKLMVALPEMGKEGATQMLKVALATGEIDKIRKEMEAGIIQGSSATAVAMEKVGSTIDRLRATSAATAPAITDFVKRVGAVGAQSGISIDQIAALGATVDALGMRVEMSATALSRMIPAIKNNAFDVAKAIGVTPDTLRNLFETGRGMEAILMIFQHIKDSGMDENSVESMLGMGNMKEIMKELNQQGARAGIVFAGLSQNVDVLKSQLKTAGEAYKENTAIQSEYNKMNETTAAKWERLKNQMEKFFVGDASQRFFGSVIDKLRILINLITDNGPLARGLRYIAVYIGLLKSKWSEAIGTGILNTITFIRNIRENFAKASVATGGFIGNLKAAVTSVNGLKNAWKGLDAAMKANIITAVAGALWYLYTVLKDWHREAKEAAAEAGRFNEKLTEEKNALDALFVPLKKDNAAQDERSRLISEINSKYGKYLGYMLSETNSAIELANAHELIAKRIREEAYEKRILDQEDKVREKHSEDINAAYGGLEKAVRGGAKGTTDIGAVTDMLKGFVDQSLDKISTKEGYTAFRGDLNNMLERLVLDGKLNRGAISSVSARLLDYMDEAKDQAADIAKSTAATRSDLRNVQRGISGSINANLNNLIGNLKTFGQAKTGQAPQGPGMLARPKQTAGVKLPGFEVQQYGTSAGGSQAAAEIPLPSWRPNINKKNIEEVKNFIKAQDDLRGYLKANADHISEQARATANAYLVSEEEMKELRALLPKKVGGGTGGGGDKNVWGSTPSADSTDYGTWDVNELVARRNQMDKFKNILKPDTDVKAVLAEDKALMKALQNGLSSDWKSVMNWYNQERLKIQEELKSERFSTNQGHWRDEKQGRGRRNRFRESDYALAELDRYYSKRKEELEKARIDENMSEELFNRQAELLEQEHLERRSKLRETFTAGETAAEKEMVKKFREWWKQMEDAGNLDNVPWATVESEWSKALASDIGRNNLRAQQDMTKMEEITVKHLNKIADIIDKERPYDGITANLRDNLIKMDLLFADYDKNGTTDAATLVQAQSKRLKFFLGEAEHAYTMNWENLQKNMREKGFGSLADEIGISEDKKQQLLAQLRLVYDAIQEAIKKEANVIKKQVDILWNDVLPDRKQSLKQSYETAISALGLTEDQVKRANSLISAGVASERVADKLAIKQMQVRLAMQEHYYNLIRKTGEERIAQLKAAGKEEDAEHIRKSLNLSLSEEQKKLDEQRVAIANNLEESQNRLYSELKEWAELLSSSLQGVFEATHAGDAEYYNELAKLNLTGKGGPGAGTYIVIDNEGTSDATAHYEYLDERAALERQREIEQQNAEAEAWKKLMDDLNMKMSEQITDWINASMQNKVVEDNTKELSKLESAIKKEQSKLEGNTTATKSNTETTKQTTEASVGALASNTQAIVRLTNAILGKGSEAETPGTQGRTAATSEAGGVTDSATNTGSEFAADKQANYQQAPVSTETAPAAAPQMTLPESTGDFATDRLAYYEAVSEAARQASAAEIEASNATRDAVVENEQIKTRAVQDANIQKTETVTEGANKEEKTTKEANKHELSSTETTFDKMIRSINTYGMAYQVMANDNLSASQKFQMFALQAAGEAAIGMLTTNLVQTEGQTQVELPGILGKAAEQLGPIAGPIAFSAMMALLGGLMGLAVSKVAKSKSQISQITGASMSAGRLSTGMMTYAEGNVNEFTDPATLTPGRSYNVDAADGRTYRAKYTGTNPRTHLTNGPEFHLAGERGREMIIDAGTTREITMNETEIWHAIQTLRNGGHVGSRRGSRRGVRAFADGNIEDFETMDMTQAAGGLSPEMAEKFQTSIDRNNDLLERALTEGIKGVFNVYGKGGMVDTYDTAKKSLKSHGERY